MCGTAFIAVFMIFTACYTSLFLFVKELFRDQWYWYQSFIDVDLLDLFFISANQHRVVIPGFFIWLDIHLFQHSNFLINITGFLAIIAYSLLLIRFCYKNSFNNKFIVFFSASILFWMGNYTFGRPLFAVTENLMLFFVVCALMYASERRVLWACIFSLLSSFSFSLGVLAWPAVAVIVLRYDLKKAIYILALGLLVLVLYVFLPGGAGIQSEIKIEPLLQIHFIFSYLGVAPAYALSFIPVVKNNIGVVSLLFGILAILMTCYIFYKEFLLSRSAINSNLNVFLLGIIVFVVLSALLTALGRAGFDPVSVRFVNFVVLMWLAFWIWFYLSSNQEMAAIIVGLIFVSACMLSQLNFSDNVSQERWKADKSMLSFHLGVPLQRDAKELAGWPYNTEVVNNLYKKLTWAKLQLEIDMEYGNSKSCSIKDYKLYPVPPSQFLTKNADVEYYQAWFKLPASELSLNRFLVVKDNEIIGLGVARHQDLIPKTNYSHASILTKQAVQFDKDIYLVSKRGACHFGI